MRKYIIRIYQLSLFFMLDDNELLYFVLTFVEERAVLFDTLVVGVGELADDEVGVVPFAQEGAVDGCGVSSIGVGRVEAAEGEVNAVVHLVIEGLIEEGDEPLTGFLFLCLALPIAVGAFPIAVADADGGLTHIVGSAVIEHSVTRIPMGGKAFDGHLCHPGIGARNPTVDFLTVAVGAATQKTIEDK